MTTTPIRSAYLLSPRLINPSHRWAGFSSPAVVISRVSRPRPQIIWRGLMALLIWCFSAGTYTYFSQQSAAGAQTTIAARDAVATTAATTSAPVIATTVSTATANPTPAATPTPAPQPSAAKPAATLAGDPTGQILPPIQMAPPYTFANNYDWGQCTWYVAGRRQVPSNWGNAVSWYFRAQAAGWSVGTTPAIGAIAWTPAGALGHVALVEQISPDYSRVYISEMNFAGEGEIDHRWVATNSFKYIYN